MDEEADSISNLPDILLSSIISSLTITEAARTSTFSQRWKTLWKYSSNLNFDQSQMLKSLIEEYRESSNIGKRLERAVRRKADPNDESNMDPIAETAMLIKSIVDNHIGTLESCCILHLLESSASGDVLRWMKKLRQKGVMKVSMEVEIRDDHHTIIPFDVFTSFKDLELKNYFIIVKPCPNHHQVLKTLTLNNVRVFSDNFQEILPQSNIEVIEIGSIFCNPEDLVFETPKLLVLHAHNDVKKLGKQFTTRDIIEICSGILGCQGSTIGSIFDNLVTLCLDIDFKNIRDSIALSFAIKSCHQLKTLQIQNQVNMNLIGEVNNQNDNDSLPYPGILFWQKREPCDCLTYKLKSVCIKGYIGGEFELEFVKYLILNGGAMENITIWFLDDCLWSEVVATICLLSYPKLSPKLSFDLKPGVQYMTKYDSNFDKWVISLR
ncbi:hypothetical protein P8452_56496 [Trifolium repens]|nr:hypothetical protein P8452_56496 [Trifolium repens]